MRILALRNFQRNLSKEAQDLPIVVTKDGKPAFVVMPYVTPEPIDPGLGNNIIVESTEKKSFIKKALDYLLFKKVR